MQTGGVTAALATLTVTPVNDAPELTGAKAILADGTEDVAYTINAADLLKGYTDIDGDTLSVTGLTTSVGTLANNNDGNWTLTAPQNFNGKVDLSYSVSDGNGASAAGSQSFSLTPVNDAPVVAGAVNLGEMLEDGTFRITSEQLLANATDVDGDTLSVTGLKLASGQAPSATTVMAAGRSRLMPTGMAMRPSPMALVMVKARLSASNG